MRPRRVLVLVHRWLALVLLAWVIIVAATGAWLVGHQAIESWFDGDRYRATPGDIGPQAATDAALEAFPEGAESYGLTLPRNGRGVYQVFGEVLPPEGSPETVEPTYLTAFVDPGSGTVNSIEDEEAGASLVAVPRAHVPLAGLGLVRGVRSRVRLVPSERRRRRAGRRQGCRLRRPARRHGHRRVDRRRCSSSCCSPASTSGTGRACAVGRRRSSSAAGAGRSRSTCRCTRSSGFVVWIPLLVVAFTGVAFAFPNMNTWYENATPAQRDFDLWVPPRGRRLRGRRRPGADRPGRALGRSWRERYPERAIDSSRHPVRRDRSTTGLGDARASTRGPGRAVPATPTSRSTSSRARSSTTARRGRQRLRPGLGRLDRSRCTPATSAAPCPCAVDPPRSVPAGAGSDWGDHVRDPPAEASPSFPPRYGPCSGSAPATEPEPAAIT